MASIYNDSTTSAYGNSSIEVRSSRRRRRFISSPDEMDKLFEALSIPSPSDPALEVKVVEEDCPYIRQNPNDADILLHPRIQRYLIRALRFHRFSSIYNDVPDMFILGRKGRIYSNIAKCKIERGEGIGCRYMPGINENEVARASVQLYKADAIPAALVIVAHKYGDYDDKSVSHYKGVRVEMSIVNSRKEVSVGRQYSEA